MVVIRAFIAISLSPEIRSSLEEVSDKLKERLPGVPIRWVPAENVHLTIKFLGDVSVSNLEILQKILQTEACQHSPFEFSVGNLGAYPSISRPRVIWVGVQAPDELHALQRGIEAETGRLGYAREKRSYSPHLTLGRVSRNADASDTRRIRKVLKSCTIGFLGATRVHQVHLYRSELQSGGAVYSKILSAPFTDSYENLT